ncbi:hypothetical protein Nepgr_010120 [Nepenthes gracilis]|uniref:G3BP-like protein n=1 Tax=Nepenthes gracilis TaxID=150966 RepID=A0AAD3XL12_NEPGR|nr:hypothetical protein Nepgr_010120 [Nepenthes gracilis]
MSGEWRSRSVLKTKIKGEARRQKEHTQPVKREDIFPITENLSLDLGFRRMATTFMTAAQVGSYFVTQYYQMLQQQPEFVHRLYSDASTMLRIDGHTRVTATTMLQIHALVTSMHFTAIEIKTAHSLDSWNRGVIVMVTGSVQIRDYSNRKKFAETFFLAPQEKGYFVLNDIFHFIDEEQVHPYPAAVLVQNNLNAKLTASPTIPETAPNYMMDGELQIREYLTPVDVKENGTVDKYPLPEQRLQQVPDAENILQDLSGEQTNCFLDNAMNVVHEVPPSPIEESAGEPQKHTYASILRVAKGQSGPSLVPPPSSNNNMASASDWHHTSQQNNQQPAAQQPQQSGLTSVANDSLEAEAAEEVLATDFRGEIKSVYVRNLPPTVSAAEIEDEFKKFGILKPAGVAIRRLKDTDVCYAFVEFEDISSVQDAIKAAAVHIAGRQVYIEERRANSSFARGRRGRGRGRAAYQPDASRGRFGGRSVGRGGSQAGGSGGEQREYNRPRGNGYYRQTAVLDKEYSSNQSSRVGQIPSESTAA